MQKGKKECGELRKQEKTLHALKSDRIISLLIVATIRKKKNNNKVLYGTLLLQVTECPTGVGRAAHAANYKASAGARCVQPTVNNVTFRSQPDVKVFGNTQTASQAKSEPSMQSTAAGRGGVVDVASSASCSLGEKPAGAGAASRVGTPSMATNRPNRNESFSRNVSSWTGFPVPDEDRSTRSTVVRNNSVHTVSSENVIPLGVHSISANTTNVLSVNPNMAHSGFYSVSTMNRTPVVKMGSGAKTPSVVGKVHTPELKLPPMEGSGNKFAAREQCTVTEVGGKRGADNTESVSRRSGSGWEHLDLYHSNRESRIDQGEEDDQSKICKYGWLFDSLVPCWVICTVKHHNMRRVGSYCLSMFRAICH